MPKRSRVERRCPGGAEKAREQRASEREGGGLGESAESMCCAQRPPKILEPVFTVV